MFGAIIVLELRAAGAAVDGETPRSARSLAPNDSPGNPARAPRAGFRTPRGAWGAAESASAVSVCLRCREEATKKVNRGRLRRTRPTETLRDKGYSKSKAAAIANAQANEGHVAFPERAARRPRYEETGPKDELGRARHANSTSKAARKMTKDELIEALQRL